MTKSSFPTVKSLTRSHVVARCASSTPTNSPDEHKYLQVKSQPGWRHLVCTWMSSSSSLCLRLLYRNMSRLLRASPDQTAVTAGSWCGGPSAVHHCTPQTLRISGDLDSGSTQESKSRVGSRIRPGLKAEWSARVRILQTPSTVNM